MAMRTLTICLAALGVLAVSPGFAQNLALVGASQVPELPDHLPLRRHLHGLWPIGDQRVPIGQA